MSKIEAITIGAACRDELERLVRDRNTAQRVIRRARIVLLAADGMAAGRLPALMKLPASAAALMTRSRARSFALAFRCRKLKQPPHSIRALKLGIARQDLRPGLPLKTAAECAVVYGIFIRAEQFLGWIGALIAMGAYYFLADF